MRGWLAVLLKGREQCGMRAGLILRRSQLASYKSIASSLNYSSMHGLKVLCAPSIPGAVETLQRQVVITLLFCR